MSDRPSEESTRRFAEGLSPAGRRRLHVAPDMPERPTHLEDILAKTAQPAWKAWLFNRLLWPALRRMLSAPRPNATIHLRDGGSFDAAITNSGRDLRRQRVVFYVDVHERHFDIDTGEPHQTQITGDRIERIVFRDGRVWRP